MQEISFATKQRSLEKLPHYKQHHQQIYSHTKHKGKIVLRHYLKNLNRQTQQHQGNS